jgi:hypothetical protein
MTKRPHNTPTAEQVKIARERINARNANADSREQARKTERDNIASKARQSGRTFRQQKNHS